MWGPVVPPPPFEITGAGGTAVARGGRAMVSFAGPGEARMFRRRAIRWRADGPTERVEALVAELDGVRAYVQQLPDGTVGVIVSRLDLNV